MKPPCRVAGPTGLVGGIRNLFLPVYDELSVFLMAVLCIALVATDSTLRNGLWLLFTSPHYDKGYVQFLMWSAVFVTGLAVALVQVFTRRGKGPLTKTLMMFFALCLNGVAGVVAGIHAFHEVKGLWVVLPVWNICNGLILLWYIGMADQDRIADSDATAIQVVVGLTVAGITFAACRYLFKLHWSITLSICVVYASNVNALMQRLWTKAWKL